MTLKLVREQLTLMYGMQLFVGTLPEGAPHPRATFRLQNAGDVEQDLALHTITGSRDEIRAQLLQSIDAFFEVVEPIDPITGEPPHSGSD